MLQHRELNRSIIADLLPEDSAPPLNPKTLNPKTLNERSQEGQSLEEQVNGVIARLRSERKNRSAKRGLATQLAVTLDEWLRTDEPEFLDRSDYDDEDKVKIVAQLNRFNRVVQAYWRFLLILKPYIQHLHKTENRKIRILELASGSGEFTLALAERAQKQKLPVEIFGSDYVEAHVAEGNRKAREKGISAGFRTINAFDMHNVEPGEFDIIFIAQTMHHFTPGQLAKMIAQASEKATYAFIGIDGRRGLDLFGLLPGMWMLNPHYGFMHDSIVSMRKMYSEPELELIASYAAPDRRVSAFSALPGYSVLEVLRSA